VAHVIGTLNRGGAETVCLDLCRAITPTEVEQTFITMGRQEGSLADEFRAQGALVRPCRLAPIGSFVPRMLWCLRSMRPDVVVSHVSLASGMVLLLARAAGVPRRVSRLWSEGDGRPDTRPRRMQRALMRWLLRHTATDVVGVSAAALRFADPPDGDARYRVLYNSVDGSRVGGWDRAAARQRWNLPADACVVLHIGRAVPEKNRPFVIEVHRILRQLRPGTRLLAVGPGGIDDLVSAYPAIADDPLITLAGETDEIASALAAADVLLLPSRREGFPGVVLEALAAGIPVLASDLPCLREISTHLSGLSLLAIEDGPRRWAQTAMELARTDAAGRHQISQSLRSSPFLLEQMVQEWRTLWRASVR
jgi:glycosyltransferase involved in cell wall biosynthesis